MAKLHNDVVDLGPGQLTANRMRCFQGEFHVAFNLDAVLREVHRSNMSKLGRDGKPLIREDGKVVKSESYFLPDIASILSPQAR